MDAQPDKTAGRFEGLGDGSDGLSQGSETSTESRLSNRGHRRRERGLRARYRFGPDLAEVRVLYERAIARVADRTSTAAGDAMLSGAHIVRARLDAMRQDLRRERGAFLSKEDELGRVPSVVAFAESFVAQAPDRICFDELIATLSVKAGCAEFSTYDLWALPTALSNAAIRQLSVLANCGGDAATGIIVLHALLAKVQNAEWVRTMPVVSGVDRVLARDPSGVFTQMDFETQDTYRQAVAKIALRTRLSEREVAEAAVECALPWIGSEQVERAHVGFYLIGQGRAEFFSIFSRVPWHWTPTQVEHAFVSLSVGLLALVGWSAWWLAASVMGNGPPAALAALAVLLVAGPLTFGAMKICVLRFQGPREVLRLWFDRRIPIDAKTLVVIPCLLRDRSDVDRLCEQLLMHRLRNRLDHVSYALLTDWSDSDYELCPSDQVLVDEVALALERLNSKHGWQTGGFALLHRGRAWSEQEGTWLGRGRKFGKLQDLNQFLHNGGGDQFTQIRAKEIWLRGVQYVITVDEDTELPWGTVSRLIATMHHPLNRPRLSKDGARLEHGHGVLQPAMTAYAFSTDKTAYQGLSTLGGGLKAYQSSAPNFYHDVFGVGCYTGKGIYSVACGHALVSAHLCDQEILSHDLIEGCLLRGTAVSDVELFETAPRGYAEEMARLHRWVRGDTQSILWMLTRRRQGCTLSTISKFKLWGALAHHIFDVAALALVLVACTYTPSSALIALILCAFFGGTVYRSIRRLARAVVLRNGFSHREGWRSVARDVERSLLLFGTLPGRALVVLTGIVVAAYRFIWSRRLLLQWRTFRDEQARSVSGPPKGLIVANTCGVATAIALTSVGGQASLWITGIVCVLWIMAPLHLRWLSRQRMAPKAQRTELIPIAWNTWRCIRSMLADSHSGLIPDSTGPEGIDSRTSPTNIGMSLISVVSAERLGFISRYAALNLVIPVLRTTRQLERRDGHLFNWYDTQSGQALGQDLSSADSANFVASLTALRAWIMESPVSSAQLRIARSGALLCRTLGAGMEERERAWIERFAHAFETLATGKDGGLAQLQTCVGALPCESGNELIKELGELGEECIRSNGPAHCRAGVSEASELIEALLDCDFSTFEDVETGLLKVSIHDRTPAHGEALYDLLASESRLAVMVGVARGELSSMGWRRLDRAKVGVGIATPCLLSWSGSLFEHLMPEIFFRAPPESLLAISYAGALHAHQADAAFGVWGRAECGYGDSTRLAYAPHGAHAIALSSSERPANTVAPYASALALPCDVQSATENLLRLSDVGAYSADGFYESITFEADGRSCVLQRHFAHHQGMILAAICNSLTGGIVELVGADDEMRAATSLLCEAFPEEAELRTLDM